MASNAPLVKHTGGCHCGAVKFEVMAPAQLTAYDCNCSICMKKQNIHFIVPHTKFKLLSGEDALTTYRFNTGKAQHKFCKFCGVQSFYQPRSNPSGYGVMPHCLNQETVENVTVIKFNGDNWEKSMEKEATKPVPISTWSE